MIKVYIYYDLTSTDPRFMNRPEVYAFTLDKKISSEFSDTRNMNVLRLIPVSLKQDEFVKFSNSNALKKISRESMSTIDKSKNVIDVKVLLTAYEKGVIDDAVSDCCAYMCKYKLNPTIFKRKYLDVLAIVRYAQCYAINCTYTNFDDDELNDAPNLIIDELAVFVDCFYLYLRR